MTPPSSRRFLLAAALGAGLLALAGCQKPAAESVLPAAAPASDSMTLGDPKARVHVEEYASVTCSHCAEFANTVFPAFKAKYIDTGQVKYTLHEFLTGPREVAAAGFMTARCAGKDKYFSVIEDLFRQQAAMFESGDVSGTLTRIAASAGMDEAALQACLSDKSASDALTAKSQAAIDKGVQATPTFIVNGRKVKEGVMSLAELDAAVAEALR